MSREAPEAATRNRALREWLPVIGTGFVAVIVLAGFVGFLDVLKNAPSEPPHEEPVKSEDQQVATETPPPDDAAGSADGGSDGTPGVETLGEDDLSLLGGDDGGGGSPSAANANAEVTHAAPPMTPKSPLDPVPGTGDSFGGRSAAYLTNLETVVSHTRGVVANRAQIAQTVLAGTMPPEAAAALVHADALQVNATRHLLSTMAPPAEEQARHARILAAHDTLLVAYAALERCVVSEGVASCPESVLAFDTGSRALSTAVAEADAR